LLDTVGRDSFRRGREGPSFLAASLAAETGFEGSESLGPEVGFVVGLAVVGFPSFPSFTSPSSTSVGCEDLVDAL